jgi:hypothetical protein
MTGQRRHRKWGEPAEASRRGILIGCAERVKLRHVSAFGTIIFVYYRRARCFLEGITAAVEPAEVELSLWWLLQYRLWNILHC